MTEFQVGTIVRHCHTFLLQLRDQFGWLPLDLHVFKISFLFLFLA